MESYRKVYAYKKYFLDFYEKLDAGAKKKTEWVLRLLETVENIPVKYFKHIEGIKGLYEVRVEYQGNIYRIFSFFDEGKLIVLGNAFQKKSRKTPKNQISKALKIKEEYLSEK